MQPKNSEEAKDFFKDSKLLDEDGQPILLWHGSRVNTLKKFDYRYEGTGTVSSAGRKYGGFFFGEDKEGAEYYCYGGAPEEEIDKDKGEIFIETYGNDETGWFFITSQRDDRAYSREYNRIAREYREEHGADANTDDLDCDIEEEIEELGNSGPYDTPGEAYDAGKAFVDEYNECAEKDINPYLYPIHLRMKKPYIHDTNKDGFKPGHALVTKVAEMDEGYDGIKIIDIFDGDRVMNVYIIFDPENVMILDKMDPDNCAVKLNTNVIESIIQDTVSEEPLDTPSNLSNNLL